MIQWLGLHAFNAKGAGSISGQGTKIPQATQCGKKRKERESERAGTSSVLLTDLYLAPSTVMIERTISLLVNVSHF